MYTPNHIIYTHIYMYYIYYNYVYVICTYIFVYMYICVYIYIYIYIYIHTHTCVCVCVCVRVWRRRVCACSCACAPVYVRMELRVCLRAHTCGYHVWQQHSASSRCRARACRAAARSADPDCRRPQGRCLSVVVCLFVCLLACFVRHIAAAAFDVALQMGTLREGM